MWAPVLLQEQAPTQAMAWAQMKALMPEQQKLTVRQAHLRAPG
jgi:hypothetical protein